MPRRAVTIHLWQIVCAFVAVTAAFVIATWIATNASSSAHRTAVEARSLSVQNEGTLRRADRIRAELVRKIHAQDVVNCRRISVLDRDLRASIERSLAQTRAALRGPTAKLPGVADLFRRSIAESRRLLRDLHGADCPGVPPLSPPPTKASP